MFLQSIDCALVTVQALTLDDNVPIPVDSELLKVIDLGLGVAEALPVKVLKTQVEVSPRGSGVSPRNKGCSEISKV
jgi:hypothetical protein